MARSEAIATFTRQHPETGRKQERFAYTPAEAVSLRADGWLETPEPASTSTSTSGASAKSGTSAKSST